MRCMSNAQRVIERYYELLAAGDIDNLLAMYTDDAEIIRYDGVASTPAEMREYFRQHLERHPGLRLHQIDRIREADDILMWDAMLDTDHGLAQVVHVVVIDDDGRFHRHIPGLRGYWGG
jgi:ketosteroid isomerase-like protein